MRQASHRVLTGPMTDVTRVPLDLLTTADQALVRTVDGLADESYATPSLLPDWTRGHVVAHLVLNAEGLAGVLTGAHLGEPQPMYDSPEARDDDIAELAAAAPAELRERLMGSTTTFAQAVAAMRDPDWAGRFERTPGGPSFALPSVPLMRVREVEIHHADLGSGYAAADWPHAFTALLLDSMTKRPYPAPFTAEAADLDHTWQYGEGDDGPVVTGGAADLGWWLTGRGSGEGLASDTGSLPRIEAW